jgi:hypothetical protein
VIGHTIFVKNQADLLMVKMQGLIEIEYVYDLFKMEQVVGKADGW